MSEPIQLGDVPVQLRHPILDAVGTHRAVPASIRQSSSSTGGCLWSVRVAGVLTLEVTMFERGDALDDVSARYLELPVASIRGPDAAYVLLNLDLRLAEEVAKFTDARKYHQERFMKESKADAPN